MRWTIDAGVAHLTLPAKLNIFLEIHGKRPDGFHELTTLMIPIDLADRLEVRESDSDCLEVIGHEAGAVEDNLVMRALQLMRNHGAVPPLHMRLDKRIPAGTGLGGGSSDAAGMLAYLDSRYCLGRGRDLMVDAAQLGSDVPFFLGDGPAVATGRGEQIARLEGALFGGDDVTFALLLPGLHSSSAAAYRHVSLPLTSPDGPISFHPRLFTQSNVWVSSLFNRLERAVLSSHPQLQPLAHWLDNRVAGRWRMTGSGSGFYVVCMDGSEAGSLIDQAQEERLLDGLELRGCIVRPLADE